jgi:sulfate permease, SulP family
MDRARVAAVLPALRWLRGYDRATFGPDLVAGLTVAVMLVPQAMAYAALAGMPPVTGLYAAIVPLVVYALLGTSGQLAFGPVAIVSLLTASALAPLAGGDPATYVGLAAVLALLVGALLLLMGLLRLGALVNFLSHSVISGFTSAAALIIGFSQARELLGIDAERSESLLRTLTELGANAATANPATVVVGVGSVLVLLAGRKLVPRAPVALLVVVVATGATALLGLADAGVAILGDVPAGLPRPALPAIEATAVLALLPSAAAIALISYLEGISVARAIAAKTRQHIDADAELIASGAANLAAGAFQSFPVAGGFSRTAVNHQAGARTPMSSLVTAAVVALTVAFLTPLLFHLPRAVLAAVIVVAVVGLIDVEAVRHAWRVRRSDAVVLAATFAATLLLGVEPGIGVGVAVSLGLLLWRTSTPHAAELGRVAGTTRYRNTDRYLTRTDEAVAILRVDGPLYFASAKFVDDRVGALLAERPALRAVVLDCSAVTDLDTDGEHALAELDRKLGDAGVALHLATVRGPVRDLLERAGAWERMAGRIHPAIPAALEATGLPAGSPLRRAGEDETCPEEVF